MKKTQVENVIKAQVHCFICSHTVPADVTLVSHRVHLVTGQRCPRCSSPLEAAKIIEMQEAA